MHLINVELSQLLTLTINSRGVQKYYVDPISNTLSDLNEAEELPTGKIDEGLRKNIHTYYIST